MLWLDDNELYTLTGFRRRSKQLEVLAAIQPKLDYRIRPHDSFPLVPRAQFDRPLELARKKREPNFEVSHG